MKRLIFEIAAVLLTGILKIVFVDVIQAKFWYIIITGTFWLLYILIRTTQKSKILEDWGFKKEGFWSSVRIILIPAIVVTLLSMVEGLQKDHLIWNWHIIPIMILYPIWGTIQQLLVLSIFGGNLMKIIPFKHANVLVVILTAVLFSIVHYPSLQLVIVTFFLALFYMILFLKYRNLWALGLFHGWLACIFYFFALGRDPWIEFIDTI